MQWMFRYNQQQFQMEQIEANLKQVSPQRQAELLAKTSIQNLYHLLGKNAKGVITEPTALITIDRKYHMHRPTEGIRVNLDYSRVPSEVREDSPTRKATILEGFHKKTRKYCNQKKKTLSVEVTNNRLKDIIFGKRQEKKASFFDGMETEPHRNIPVQRIEPNLEMIKNGSREALKRYETECEQKAQVVSEIDLNHHFIRFKESMKLKPIEYYIKKTKNSKFSIMGLSVKKHKKINSKESTQAKQYLTEQLQLAIMRDGQKAVSQWKIDSLSLKLGDQKRKFNATNAAKLKNKNSLDALVGKCLPYLMISEHILWKLQEMINFYSLVMLSFHCTPMAVESIALPKYHRKHIKYSYFVGGGNNRALIIELMEKRWWWRQTNDISEANFIWTQQKLKNYSFKPQQSSITSNVHNQQQRLDRAKLDKLKKRYYQAQHDQKCKSLFQSFQSSKTSQLDEFQTVITPSLIYNHMSGGKFLGNKKSLFQLFKIWFQVYKGNPEDVFSFIPETYYVESTQCEGFEVFQKVCDGDNLWIIKPGQNSNRGKGIFLSSQLKEIVQGVESRSGQGGTTIIQRYLSNLLFYNGRKFDIRAYLLCITIGSNCKYYWYQEGYLRTSSHPFSLKQLSSMTHLTNDAIQNQGEQYGRYEKGNKLSYSQFQSYLQDNSYSRKMSELRTAMKRIAKIVAAASHPIINCEKKTGFQLFGMDFLVDASFKPWLLQVNTNPCLQLSCPLLQKLIPNAVENALRIAVDSVFPPTVLPNKESQYTMPEKMTEWNKFQLIFDERLQADQQWKQILGSHWPSPKQAKDKSIQ